MGLVVEQQSVLNQVVRTCGSSSKPTEILFYQKLVVSHFSQQKRAALGETRTQYTLPTHPSEGGGGLSDEKVGGKIRDLR